MIDDPKRSVCTTSADTTTPRRAAKPPDGRSAVMGVSARAPVPSALVYPIGRNESPRRWRRWVGAWRSWATATIVLGIVAAVIGFNGDASADDDTAVTDSVDTTSVEHGVSLQHGVSLHHGVSVVIPTHDRAAWLEVALKSVMSSPLISSPAQVIVVDDDSHDETPEVVRRWGARHVRVAVHSAARSRNAGWQQA